MALCRFLGVAELTSHSREFSQCFDNRQITASQRALALLSASFHLSPGRIPVCGSRVKVDLIDQTRLVLDQPPLHRHRRTAVPAGMTQEHPRHNPHQHRHPKRNRPHIGPGVPLARPQQRPTWPPPMRQRRRRDLLQLHRCSSVTGNAAATMAPADQTTRLIHSHTTSSCPAPANARRTRASRRTPAAAP